jgi:uncharacterized protein
MLESLKSTLQKTFRTPKHFKTPLSVCIVGASKGLGLELAKQLCDHKKYHLKTLLLVARNKEQLEFLEQTLSKLLNQTSADKKIFILCADVTKQSFQDILLKKLTEHEINVVFNCAGIGFLGKFLDSNTNEINSQLNLNVTALTNISHTVAKHFTTHFEKNSQLSFKNLVHISSSASFSPLPGMAVYAASKSYVLNLCLALDSEFKSFGASCVVVCPGPINTTLFDWSKTGLLTSSTVQSVSECAKDILTGLMAGEKIIVTGASNKILFALSEVLPSQIKKFIAGKVLSKGAKK